MHSLYNVDYRVMFITHIFSCENCSESCRFNKTSRARDLSIRYPSMITLKKTNLTGTLKIKQNTPGLQDSLDSMSVYPSGIAVFTLCHRASPFY